MPAIIVLAVIAIVALMLFGVLVHVLFSPFLLVVIAIVAWITFRARRSRR